MIKLLARMPLIVLLAFTITACGGGSSSIIDAIIDDGTDHSWKVGEKTYFAGDTNVHSVALGIDVLESTSFGFDREGNFSTSIVTMSFTDRGAGLYTIVSSFADLIDNQDQNPLGRFIFIAVKLISLQSSSDTTTYISFDDTGTVNVTSDSDNTLHFNIPSPINILRDSGDGFPELPFNILFTLIDIFEDLPLPSLPKPE